MPKRDLYLSPEHALFFDDMLVPARHLVNGSSICAADGIQSIHYFHVETAEHDVIYAEGAAAETFIDCDSRGMFHNAAEFAELYPNRPSQEPMCCVPVVESGEALAILNTRLLNRAQQIGLGTVQSGPMRGNLDHVSPYEIRGWAQLESDRDAAVCLEVFDNGTRIAGFVASRYREDLERAGIGNGRHAFVFQFAAPLDSSCRHEIVVRRPSDSQELTGSPAIIEPALLEDDATCTMLASYLTKIAERAASPSEAQKLLRLLA